MSYTPVVGMKVVCINDQFKENPQEGEIFPKLNQVYTIRSIRIPDPKFKHRGLAILLEGIFNPKCRCRDNKYYEFAFLQDRFRPVIEKKQDTDISIFKRFLIDVNSPILEEV